MAYDWLAKMVQKVFKHNDLITSHFALTLNEYRLILYAISMINPLELAETGTLQVEVSRFCSFFNLPTNDMYRQLKNAVLTTMFKRHITTYSDQFTNGRMRFNFLEEAHYHDANGQILIVFHKRIRPFLYNLNSNFTSYSLEHIARFNSIYSIRLYEISLMYLKQQKSHQASVKLSVQELKNYLGIHNKYSLYASFKQRVLNKAISEINDKSDIYIAFTESKKNRAVHTIHLNIKDKFKMIDDTWFDETLKV